MVPLAISMPIALSGHVCCEPDMALLRGMHAPVLKCGKLSRQARNPGVFVCVTVSRGAILIEVVIEVRHT